MPEVVKLTDAAGKPVGSQPPGYSPQVTPQRLEAVGSIHDIDPDAWDACAGTDNPFTEHAFLAVLEDAGCLGEENGWYPHHLVVRDGPDGRILGVAPLYARTNSQGEYIFDHGWANGAMRAGLPYYPKLSVAVPFTPATGPRALLRADLEDPTSRDAVLDALSGGALELARRIDASGVHWLFCPEHEARALADRGLIHRLTYQFHWRNAGYAAFDDFLAHLTRKRRKEIRRERRKAYGHGLRIELRTGETLTASDWEGLYAFYQATHANRPWQQVYLNRTWFHEAGRRLGHRAVAVIAYDGDTPVAGSLSFRKGPHLYGRYWGALTDLDALHFECCYYRLVEYAIHEGITLFEAGAQGAHKLRRGFLPALTHSAHRLLHPGLHDAVARYVEQEAAAVRREVEAGLANSPFRDRD